MAADGKYAFVEFQNDRIATAAMPIFNGMEVFGRRRQTSERTFHRPRRQKTQVVMTFKTSMKSYIVALVGFGRRTQDERRPPNWLH